MYIFWKTVAQYAQSLNCGARLNFSIIVQVIVPTCFIFEVAILTQVMI